MRTPKDGAWVAPIGDSREALLNRLKVLGDETKVIPTEAGGGTGVLTSPLDRDLPEVAVVLLGPCVVIEAPINDPVVDDARSIARRSACDAGDPP